MNTYTNKHKPYTDKEISLIRNEVANNPDNLEEAFRKASKKLGRTQGSISVKWYKDIKNTKEVMSINGNRNVKYVNRKNTLRKSKNNVSSELSDTLNLLFENLEKDSKIQFINQKLRDLLS